MDAAAKTLYRMKAEVAAAAAHPIRLAILDCLRGGEQCVCDIAVHVSAGRPNVSRHLAVMLKAGLVDCRKDGLNVIYSLRACCLPAFLDCTTDMVRQQAREASALLRCMK